MPAETSEENVCRGNCQGKISRWNEISRENVLQPTEMCMKRENIKLVKIAYSPWTAM